MATVESPSSSTGTCSPSTSLSAQHNTTSHPALTITRPSCSPTPASAPFPCRTPASSRSPTSSAASSRRSSSSLSPSSSARPDSLLIRTRLLATPSSGSVPASWNDTLTSSNAHHSLRNSGGERARAQSLFSPFTDRSSSPFQDQVNVPTMAFQQRPSLPTSDTSSVRSAQLALLAEQAKMASIGTSNLRVARAHSLVVVDAMRSVAEQSINSPSKSSRHAEDVRSPTSPQASSSSELLQPQKGSPSSPSRQSSPRFEMQTPSSSRASEVTDGGVSPTTMADSTSTAAPVVASELAWQNVVTSREFLPSALHLAQMFRAQQQDRKAWAGQALEQQRRRWTMNHQSVERPAIAQLKQHNSDESVPTAGKRRSDGRGETSQGASSREGQHKRRRLAAQSPEERQKKDRRVSFAAGTAGGAADADDEMEDAETQSRSSSPAPKASTAERAPDSSTEEEPVAEDGAVVRSSARRSLSAEARPQLLENVLTSFASLLDSRQEACAGLAELAKHGNEIVEAAAAVSASRANSRACSRASSPKASKSPARRLDSCLLSTNPLDSSALDTDTSDEEADESVGDDSLENAEAASTVSSSSLREGDIAERSPEQQGTESPAAQKPEQ